MSPGIAPSICRVCRPVNSHHLAEVVGVPAAGPKADVDELAAVHGVLFENALLAVGKHLPWYVRRHNDGAKTNARRAIQGRRVG